MISLAVNLQGGGGGGAWHLNIFSRTRVNIFEWACFRNDIYIFEGFTAVIAMSTFFMFSAFTDTNSE